MKSLILGFLNVSNFNLDIERSEELFSLSRNRKLKKIENMEIKMNIFLKIYNIS